MPRLRLYLLGSFRLERDEQTLRLPTRKVESLLAYLALFPEQHPREKLAALFWGDVPDPLARGSLRKALTFIRIHLGNAILFSDRETVQLNPRYPLWTDAREFVKLADLEKSSSPSQSDTENLQAAIDLYQADLHVDCYDDWILSERERYRAFYVEILLHLTQHMRAQSEYARAIAFAQKVLTSDPANERAHQHLMFCFLASGKRDSALKQYEECQRVLQRELAVEPASETKALYVWIKQTPSDVRAIEAQITNLPIPLTSFIGRKSEMAQVKQLLVQSRLVTLIGSGGSGKTRLAIQVTTDLIDQFKDGVWWVELAALEDGSLIPQQIAKALGVQENPEQSLSDTLASWLRSRQLLLVLDNCEHLIVACAELAEKLLNVSPNLRILATSREALGITGEMTWQVASLSVPAPEKLSLTELLLSFESIRLFVERVRANKVGFALTEQNAAPIAQICQRLDGIPLAIELAAARATTLSVEQIAARLDDRFNLLTRGGRTALPRQQTLRATMDWSYDLLSEQERVLFRRLSVFAGGWTLEAAEYVCAEEEGSGGSEENPERSRRTPLLDLLSRLVNKSLVMVDEQDGAAHYRMLETIRQYAREKLLESSGRENVCKQHLEFYLKFAEEAEPRLYTAEQVTWYRRLEKEFDNIRAAMEWAQNSDNVRSGLRLAGALPGRFVANVSERRAWLDRLLTSPDASTRDNARTKALLTQGDFCFVQGDYSIARARLTEALEISRETGNDVGIAESLHSLGDVTYYQTDYAGAKALFESSLSLSRAVEAKWITAESLHMLGHVLHGLGDLVQAHAFFEESVSEYRELGDWAGLTFPMSDLAREAQRAGDFAKARSIFEENMTILEAIGNKSRIGLMLADLGYLALATSDLPAAQVHLWKSLSLFRQLGDKRFIAECLEGFAGLRVSQRYPIRAAQLFGAAEALRKATGIPVPPYRRADYAHHLAAVRARLDEEAFAKAWAEGRALTLEQAIEYALETTVDNG
ncbi:MAG: tetratricopeptide repeat protein [Chloroflexota bacterium]|nr:tetratricopeptide repeat protein [Chloroflexota bacterium]